MMVLTVRRERRFKAPLKPMIGVIGLAPAEGSIPTGTPGKHGGNMTVRSGASLYLQAAVEGGLFGCGDAHALMGDVMKFWFVVQKRRRVTLAAAVADAVPQLPTPFVETEELYAPLLQQNFRRSA